MKAHEFKKNNTNPVTQQKKTVKGPVIEDNRKPTAIQKKTNNTGLPGNLKNGIENLSGMAMDDVKVKYNSSKPAAVQAHAYAQGSEIHLAPGQEKHLPHEAWHVVQQKQGRVKPTVQMKGNVKINDDKGLENEADRMGRKALQAKNIPGKPMQLKSVFAAAMNKTASGSTDPIMQLSRWKWVRNTKGETFWKQIEDRGEQEEPDFDGEFIGELVDDEYPHTITGGKDNGKKKKKGADEDKTFKGARTFGNSGKLADNLYKRKQKKWLGLPKKIQKPKHKSKSIWKANRETQHIIPASTAKKYKSLQKIIDIAQNGIMLPAVHTGNDSKVTHIVPPKWDHPVYRKRVEYLIAAIVKKGLNPTQDTFKMVMKALRPLHRLTQYAYLDDIPYSEYKTCWNDMYGSTLKL